MGHINSNLLKTVLMDIEQNSTDTNDALMIYSSQYIPNSFKNGTVVFTYYHLYLDKNIDTLLLFSTSNQASCFPLLPTLYAKLS